MNIQEERTIKPTIVVTGCQRSGTTLVRSILAQHPHLSVHPSEPQFILELWKRYGPVIDDVPAAIDYVNLHRYKAESISPGRLATFFQTPHQPMLLRDFIHTYLQAWCGDDLRHKQVVLKDPAFIYQLDTLDKLFADPITIHVIRDPRANVSSQRARWPHLTIWECAVRWRDAIRAGKTWQQKHPGRYIELVYEQLVLEGEPTLQPLCRALRLPYNPEMLSFQLETRAFIPGQPVQAVSHTGISSDSLDVWKRRLQPMDISLIEACCEAEMEWQGYQPSNPTVSGAALRGRILLERNRYAAIRSVRRLKYRH